jgi:hypothetical protein
MWAPKDEQLTRHSIPQRQLIDYASTGRPHRFHQSIERAMAAHKYAFSHTV